MLRQLATAAEVRTTLQNIALKVQNQVPGDLKNSAVYYESTLLFNLEIPL